MARNTPVARPTASRHSLRLLVAVVVLALAGGCGILEPHKIEVQQGNIVDPEALADLRLGMTQRQVLFLLGSPVIRDPFNNGRWDYVYYVARAGESAKARRLTLFFEGDSLARIDDRYSGDAS